MTLKDLLKGIIDFICLEIVQGSPIDRRKRLPERRLGEVYGARGNGKS
jgi:hypothetical protein